MQMTGNSSGWGSRSPRTADRMERYFQQSWTESRIGEDRDNVGGIRPRWKQQEMNLEGKKLKQTVLSTWDGAIYGVGNSPTRKTPLDAWTLASVFR